MFTKLLKYEFRSVGKWYIGLYGAAIGISALIALSIKFASIQVGDNSFEISSIAELAVPLLIIALFIVLTALFLSTFFIVVNRFRENIYGRQGYLTMTLPVSTHQLILSKFVSSIIWYLLSSLTALLSLSIIMVVLVSLATEKFIEYLSSIMQAIDWYSLTGFAFQYLTDFTAGILLIYFSLSIGQLFKEHRLFFAILTYVIIYSMTTGLSTYLFLHDTYATTDNLSTLLAQTPAMTLFNILLNFVYYFATHYIMTKKLNLQ